MAYYSMLRRQRAGKFHVQVCTNVSCMLRGGNKLYEFVQKKLEIGHKETTEDGVFSLEEVECIGACTGAPAMQVNYDFYENLTIERTTQIFEALEAGRKPANLHADFRLGERTASRRSAGDQPPVRREGFAQAGGVCRATTATKAWNARSRN